MRWSQPNIAYSGSGPSGIRRMQVLSYACPPHASVTLGKSGLRCHWPQCALRGICLSHPQRQSRLLLRGSIEVRSISSWKKILNALLCSLPILLLWQWIRSASLLLLLRRDFWRVQLLARDNWPSDHDKACSSGGHCTQIRLVVFILNWADLDLDSKTNCLLTLCECMRQGELHPGKLHPTARNIADCPKLAPTFLLRYSTAMATLPIIWPACNSTYNWTCQAVDCILIATLIELFYSKSNLNCRNKADCPKLASTFLLRYSTALATLPIIWPACNSTHKWTCQAVDCIATLIELFCSA